jgi:hypothetical protein
MLSNNLEIEKHNKPQQETAYQKNVFH